MRSLQLRVFIFPLTCLLLMHATQVPVYIANIEIKALSYFKVDCTCAALQVGMQTRGESIM
jgi:hypothetical protein